MLFHMIHLHIDVIVAFNTGDCLIEVTAWEGLTVLVCYSILPPFVSDKLRMETLLI
jgi:hypothetical protein